VKPFTSLLIFSALVAFLSSMLCFVGEQRPDAYFSVAILLYFIYTSIDTSIRRRSKMLYLDIALIALFLAIVTYRILQVLGVV